MNNCGYRSSVLVNLNVIPSSEELSTYNLCMEFSCMDKNGDNAVCM